MSTKQRQQGEGPPFAEEGRRIREKRERASMTAEDFAAALEVSRGYLSELENGKRRASSKLMRRLEEFSAPALREQRAVYGQLVDISGDGDALSTSTPEALYAARSGKQVHRTSTAEGAPQGEKVTENLRPIDPYPGGSEGSQPRAGAEVQQSVASSRPFDADGLRTVVEVVAEQLDRHGLRLPPAKLAELVVLLYEHVSKERLGEEQVHRTAERWLRLVA